MKEKIESKSKPKALFWMRSSLEDLKKFPEEVTHSIGVSLLEAQYGGKSSNAKPLKGFGGASVLEIFENHQGETYRTVYTVKMEKAIYVLHAFEKKSKKGIKTPKEEIELVQKRLKDAQIHYCEWMQTLEDKKNEKK